MQTNAGHRDICIYICVVQVIRFQITPADPTTSINAMFQASPDYQPGLHGNKGHREGYEELEEQRENPGDVILIFTHTC